MKIVALKERDDNENRCAITPDVVKLFVKKNYQIMIEEDIGIKAGFTNDEYLNVGAKVSIDQNEIISDADIILKVNANNKDVEIDSAKPGTIIIGLLSPHNNEAYFAKLAKQKLIPISMELLPRTTKAQSMDVLSSQANLSGYRAVIEASYHYNKALPMMMTPAGSIKPCKCLILGVGVAGLQAIATAKRLGAIVSAFDIRPSTKEQVESLGAKFLSIELEENIENKSGYANSLSDINKQKTEKFLISIVKNYDMIITTAQIPGKLAPILITNSMVEMMNVGSVIVDMATGSGGNVVGSKKDEIIVTHNGVTIIGYSNLPSRIAFDASRLYSRNLYNLIDYAVQNDKFNLDDELIKSTLKLF
jgi:NAD(P) transhydrogenase subunit alpha